MNADDPKTETQHLFLDQMSSRYTPLQGQYLAFIYYYTKIHGCAAAETDMQAYFKVSPPSIHQMVLTLERNQLISRKPSEPRSIRLAVAREDLPDLE
jgi:repressor LexA